MLVRNSGAGDIHMCPKHKAAPDMYEALGILEQWATQKLEYNQEVAGNYNFIASARKALAKAEGKE